MKRIRIVSGEVAAEADIDDSSTAEAVWKSLPLESRANTWGEEVYFSVGLDIGEENPKEVVAMGDLGYWPPGKAVCVFFGRTPASRGDEIRPASPVNVFGKLTGDPKVFSKVRDGARIRMEARTR